MRSHLVRQLLARLFDALTLAVAISAGVYVFIHLYRWEWQRAIVSGVFVLVAEVALFGVWILRRLHRIEQRLDQQAVPRSTSATSPAEAAEAAAGAATRSTPRDRVRAARPHRRHFAWLEPDRTNVFVPVLMGTGAVLSVLAWIVERIATLSAVPMLERSLAGRLAALSPDTPLVTAAPPARAVLVRPPPSWREIAGKASFVVAVAAAAWIGIGALGDATQDRPEALVAGSATVLEVSIDHRDGRPVTEVGPALWGSCQHTLHAGSALASIGYPAPGRVRLTVTPAPGEHDLRKLRGCLVDSGIPRMAVSIVAVDEIDVED